MTKRKTPNQVEINESLAKTVADLDNNEIVNDIPRIIAKVRVVNLMLRNSVEQRRYNVLMGYSKKVDYFEA